MLVVAAVVDLGNTFGKAVFRHNVRVVLLKISHVLNICHIWLSHLVYHELCVNLPRAGSHNGLYGKLLYCACAVSSFDVATLVR